MKRLFGGILFAVGILIAGASGLCTLAVLFSGGGLGFTDVSMMGLVAVVGGVPMVLGTAIAHWGWVTLKRARDEQDGRTPD